MGLHESIEKCEECADTVEAEMPEFAKVMREAVGVIRKWDD